MSSFRRNKERLLSDHPFIKVLGVRNLRFFWAGQGISVLGTQFYMIALPWLVLKLSGDPLQVGAVLALTGVPRAMFMLLGGALTDRFSARALMIYANLARSTLVGFLAFLVMTNAIEVWMLYLLGPAFGLADAFYFPAQSSMMPQIVEPEQLVAGNSIVQGTSQLSFALGPALAGGMIAMFGGGQAAESSITGIGLAFGINAVTYLFSLTTLFFIRIPPKDDIQDKGKDEDSIWTSIRNGLVFVFKDRTLRWLLLVTGASNFFMEGPLFIGIPVLANTRFPEGAAAFGIIMSGLGSGMLLGIILAGILPKPPSKNMGLILLIIISLSGLGVMALAFIHSTYLAAAAVLVMGCAQGYVIILYTSWIQKVTPSAMHGRVFSLLMFASFGLIPISQALAGVLLKYNTNGMFIGAGLLMTIIILFVAFRPEMRSMGLEERSP